MGFAKPGDGEDTECDFDTSFEWLLGASASELFLTKTLNPKPQTLNPKAQTRRNQHATKLPRVPF